MVGKQKGPTSSQKRIEKGARRQGIWNNNKKKACVNSAWFSWRSVFFFFYILQYLFLKLYYANVSLYELPPSPKSVKIVSSSTYISEKKKKYKKCSREYF